MRRGGQGGLVGDAPGGGQAHPPGREPRAQGGGGGAGGAGVPDHPKGGAGAGPLVDVGGGRDRVRSQRGRHERVAPVAREGEHLLVLLGESEQRSQRPLCGTHRAAAPSGARPSSTVASTSSLAALTRSRTSSELSPKRPST